MWQTSENFKVRSMSQVKEIACGFAGDSRVMYLVGQDMESVTPTMNSLVNEFVEQQ